MAVWATNRKRGLIPGTVGITITVIEYDAATRSYETVSSSAYRPNGIPLPSSAYRLLESAPVSLVRPFVRAGLTELEPGRGTRRRFPASGGDAR